MTKPKTEAIPLPEWVPLAEQESQLGQHYWKVSRLIQLAKDLPVMEMPLEHLYVYYRYTGLTLRDMAMHFRVAMNADMSCPIILDEDGELMDGRHRILNALYHGRKTIKAVRFPKNPLPDRIEHTNNKD